MGHKWIKEPDYEQDVQIGTALAHVEGDLSKNTVFCFRYIHGDYNADALCNKRAGNKLQKAFIKKIQNISQITIAEVRSDDKRGLGFELLDVNVLKKSIPTSVTEDVRKVNVFRFGGDGRIVGYYSGNVFHILFIDPFLELYDHGS